MANFLASRDSTALYRHMISPWKTPKNLIVDGQEPTTILQESASWPDIESFLPLMQYLDQKTYLSDDILIKVDRAAMFASLETRVPSLDHRIVEFSRRLPEEMKIRGNTGKWLLRQVLYKYVPKEMVERPKRGFGVPIGQWLSGPLREWAENLLDEKRLASEGFFRPAPIRKIWKEHLSGAFSRHYFLWNVLMFQAWLEREKG